jgi:DNA-binding NtrC family response regulator
MEASAIRAALVATRGNKLAAARALGIARATLYEKMTALGMSLGRHAEPSPEEAQGLL